MKSKSLKIAGIVLLAVVVIFSVVSLIVVHLLMSDTFSRTSQREYTTHLYYRDAEDLYEREAVSFLSGKNRLYGHLYGAGNPEGLVVISHGLGGGEESYLAEAFYFVDHGYQVLCYSNTGCWDSEGKNCVGLCQSVLDLDAALTWVEGESRFDGVPVFLYGHSWGGYAVTAIFHFDHDITASASVAGFNDPMSMIIEWGEGMIGPMVYVEAPFIWINQKFTFGDTLGLRAVDAINSTDTPVLVLHGDQDTTVGYATTSIISARDEITNPNVRYIVCDKPMQNDHNGLFQSLDSMAYMDELQEAFDVIYEQYGGDIPEDVLQAFYEPIDKFRATAVDEEFMETVVEFYRQSIYGPVNKLGAAVVDEEFEELMEAVQSKPQYQDQNGASKVGGFILGLLAAAYGLGCLFWDGMPEFMLWLETFRKTDAPPEPSDFYRFMTRVAGVFFIGVGIFFFACVFLF